MSPNGRNDPIRIELAVNINQADDFSKIEKAVNLKGIELLGTNLSEKTIQLGLSHESEGELGDIQTLQRFIEKQTGFLVVVKGIGDLSSAVSELRPSAEATRAGSQVMGIVRLSQLSEDQCFVDALVDGFRDDSLRKQGHSCSLAVHEFGDLSSDNLESIGDPMIHISDQDIKPGRSVAVTERLDGCKFRRLSAGVIASASTIAGNRKKFCSCSGKTLWEERIDKQQE